MPIFSWETQETEILERIRKPRLLKICAKVLNEPLLIRGWLEHHARIVPRDCLIIADNMSDDSELLSVYEEFFEEVTIFRFSGPHNQIHWHPRFKKFFAAISSSCRYFSFVDADERLVRIEHDRWIADATVLAPLELACTRGIIPTTWLINTLESLDTFTLEEPHGKSALPANLRWGKPILPSSIVGTQSGIHNVQWVGQSFCVSVGTSFFLLHLTQFPRRRIETNRNKLISRGIVDGSKSVDDILSTDFSRFEDRSFLPLVVEMQEMRELLYGRFPSRPANDCRVILEPSGKLVFTTPQAEAAFGDYFVSARSLLEVIFPVGKPQRDLYEDAEFMLALAKSYLTSKQSERAERLLREGAVLHPNHLGEYGGPAFRKELLRLYLSEKNWPQADIIISEESQSGGTWHEILVARSLTKMDDKKQALIWWMKVVEREPNNGEALQNLRLLTGPLPMPVCKGSVQEELIEDLGFIRQEIKRARLQPHGFIGKFLSLAGLTVDEVSSRFHKMVDDAVQLIEADRTLPLASNKSQIPKIIHKIWLTAAGQPVDPPRVYVDQLAAIANEYDKHGWSHYLWIQDPALIPDTVGRLNAQAEAVQIVTVGDRLGSGSWTKLYEAFLADRKYPFAADVLRMQVLNEYGGIYADLGARFTSVEAANLIVNNFDYAFIFWETLFFQNSLMAMAPKSELAQYFCRMTESPYIIPSALLTPLNGLTEGMAFSGLMVTAIMLHLHARGFRICPLASNMKVVAWASEKSWYTDLGNGGKHGNAYVPSTGPSYFQSDFVLEQSLDRLLSPFPISE